MKKRKPLKRSPLAGRGELRRRLPLERGEFPGRRAPKQPRARTSHDAWKEARGRSGQRCVQCEEKCFGQVHHVLPKRMFPDLVDDARNLVWMCAGCHDEHERAHRRLPLAKLPTCAFELAAEVGDRALAYIQRTYPAA